MSLYSQTEKDTAIFSVALVLQCSMPIITKWDAKIVKIEEMGINNIWGPFFWTTLYFLFSTVDFVSFILPPRVDS